MYRTGFYILSSDSVTVGDGGGLIHCQLTDGYRVVGNILGLCVRTVNTDVDAVWHQFILNRHASQVHVAGVGDSDDVVDLIAEGDGGAGYLGLFEDRQLRLLNNNGILRSLLILMGIPIARYGGVIQRLSCVRLLHCVRGSDFNRGAYFQSLNSGNSTTDGHIFLFLVRSERNVSRRITSHGISYCDLIQRLVASVAHSDGPDNVFSDFSHRNICHVLCNLNIANRSQSLTHIKTIGLCCEVGFESDNIPTGDIGQRIVPKRRI